MKCICRLCTLEKSEIVRVNIPIFNTFIRIDHRFSFVVFGIAIVA